MEKTTSILQTITVNSIVPAEATIVRPPQSLKVFRCTIYVSSAYNGATPSQILISNFANANVETAIDLSTIFFVDTTTAVPPNIDRSMGTNESMQHLVLDRRGVGYMVDTFYVWNAGVGSARVNFVWEGIVNE